MTLILNQAYPCKSQFECTPITKQLKAGKYLLEVWGASGGLFRGGGSTLSGAGGYSHGIMLLKSATTVFIYIGGAGGNSTSSGQVRGGFNGGGYCTYTAIDTAGGGGSTDIRIGVDDLHSRIIVAGGGGGLESANAGSYGGAGGGSIGQNGKDTRYSDSFQGGGGSQTAGGFHHGTGTPPSFGFGGIASNPHSGAGGGGWYGGGAGSDGDFKDGQGGGGSGYVFEQKTKLFYPHPCLLSDSLFLIEAETLSGTQSILSPLGTGEIGHRGN